MVRPSAVIQVILPALQARTRPRQRLDDTPSTLIHARRYPIQPLRQRRTDCERAAQIPGGGFVGHECAETG
jgi:hypothetical protein